MPDNLTKKQRSYNMSRIRSKSTKSELKFKKDHQEFIYQPKIFGNPDFIDLENKIIIFIDGCFWHKCPDHYKSPKSNRHYWIPKIEKNVIRGAEVKMAYKNSGWKIKRIWEHELNIN